MKEVEIHIQNGNTTVRNRKTGEVLKNVERVTIDSSTKGVTATIFITDVSVHLAMKARTKTETILTLFQMSETDEKPLLPASETEAHREADLDDRKPHL